MDRSNLPITLVKFTDQKKEARVPGLEPGIADPKSAALPAWPHPNIDQPTLSQVCRDYNMLPGY